MIKKVLFLISYLPYRSFKKALKNPRKYQEFLLKRIIYESKQVKALREKTFLKENFQSSASLNYSDYAEYVSNSLRGGKNEAVYGKIQFFEKTSGSSSGSKEIPYTYKTMWDFFQMILVWIHDLTISHFSLESFKTFLSISASFQDNERTKRIEDDSEYLPFFFRKVFKKHILIPEDLKKTKDIKEYDDKLLSYLVEQEALEIISIWNPTYLLVYLEKLEHIYPSLKKESKRKNLPNSFRLTAEDLSRLWPNLKLISLWGDASAKESFLEVSRLFPTVNIQKKGLLSTEFPVSIPLHRRGNGHYPLVHLVYYEFKAQGKIYRLDEVDKNKEYVLILSKPGGFIKYDTNDRVRIIDFEGDVPIFEFIGRDKFVSDLVGEKLNESHVEKVLKANLKGFSFLEATREEEKLFYKLYTSDQSCNGHDIDLLLSANVHYNYARKIKQLAPLEVQISPSPEMLYMKKMQGKGLKLGDIKKSHLVKLACVAEN